jgi:hypothetical protein
VASHGTLAPSESEDPSIVSPGVVGYSLESPVSEEEFLRRELGVRWETVDSDPLSEVVRQRSEAERRTLVIVSEPEPYWEVLGNLPDRSVALLMLSDEAYTQSRCELVRSRPSVAGVIRHYGVTCVAMADVLSAVTEFVSQARGTSVSPRLAWQLFQQGRQTRKRMRDWQHVQVPVFGLALGYTNVFANTYRAFLACETDQTVSDAKSLFDLAVDFEARPRTTPMFFRGSLGQPQRQVMVDRARAIPGARIEATDEQWRGFDGAEDGSTYVTGLLDSVQALSPPGFVNNESFRYYEAVICGSQPVEATVALTHQGRLVARPISASATVAERLHVIREHMQEIRGVLDAWLCS